MEEIRQTWARKKGKYRNFDRISEYAVYYKTIRLSHLSSQTLKDIDIQNLFSFLDRTTTGIGQQFLYKKILFPADIEALKKADQETNYFIKNEDKREQVQKILYKLEAIGTYRIVHFFNVEEENDKSFREYKWLTIATLSILMSSIFFPVMLIYLIPFAAVNISLSFIFKYKNAKKLNAVKEVYGLIKACRKLYKTDTNISGNILPTSLSYFRSFERRYQVLNMGIPDDDLSKVLFYMIEMVKSIFLFDIHLLNGSYQKVVNGVKPLKELYQYIGQLDTAISTASLKCDKTIQLCSPMFTSESKILKITKAVHPLIENCVPNSICLESKSAFITGSNMSGKSTFLRTVLINVLLAQTLYISFSESFLGTLAKPFSSITIEDDLLEGSSYFFTEVALIKTMSAQISRGTNNLFVIDEVFKGTNTVERISLAKAILKFLNNNTNIVIASSHDLELIEFLTPDFEMFYFSETIEGHQLQFDHTIKPGSLKTTNAIRIVEMEKYPKRVVEEAYEMAKKLRIDKS